MASGLEATLARIEETLLRLQSEGDDEDASLHSVIADLYARLGRSKDASLWYSYGAKHCIDAGYPVAALGLSKRAISLDDTNLEAHRLASRLASLLGLDQA